MPMDVAIVDPEKELWSGEADFVVARSADGEIGILPGHAPFLGVLRFARLKVESGGEEIIFAVHGGFIEMKDNRLSVLARKAEIASDIDVARARNALERAREAAAAEDAEQDAIEAVWRAEARLQAAGESGLTAEH
jgi:F-type H+-transporting ATPase subunit epsilon